MKTTRLFTLFLVMIFLCSACQKQPLFGKDFNQKRTDLSVPTIPDNWKATSVGPNDATWRNPDSDTLKASRTPFHRSKYVSYPDGLLDFEQDTYFGRDDFLYDGSTFREELFIDCKYDSGYEADVLMIRNVNCEATYASKDGLSQNISISQAKEILKSWGLSYP